MRRISRVLFLFYRNINQKLLIWKATSFSPIIPTCSRVPSNTSACNVDLKQRRIKELTNACYWSFTQFKILSKCSAMENKVLAGGSRKLATILNKAFLHNNVGIQKCHSDALNANCSHTYLKPISLGRQHIQL